MSLLPSSLVNSAMTYADINEEVLSTIELEAGTSNSQILSSAETKRAKDVISDLENELRSLDTRPRPGDFRRAKIAARLARFRVAVAPIKRIPPEILYLIFSFMTTTAYTWMPRDQSESPWPLRAVCYSWRTIALSMPALWKNMTFSVNRTATYKLGYDYQLLSREGILTTLIIKHMVLDVSTMDSIGRGTLLPRLTVLEGAVLSPIAFLDMVKSRIGLEGQPNKAVSTLRRAWGTHTNTCYYWDDPLAEKGWRAAEEVWDLRQSTGRDLWLGAAPDPDGSCHYTYCRRRWRQDRHSCTHEERRLH